MAKPKGLRKHSVSLYLDLQMLEELRALCLATHRTQQSYVREGLARVLEEYRAKLETAR